MFSLFKGKRIAIPKPTLQHYTAAEIHGMIVARNLVLLNNITELHKKSLITTPEKIASEYSRLERVGLINTKNASIIKSKMDEIDSKNKEIEKYNAFVAFLKEMLEVFGHNVLLISFSDFEEIIKKYNLTCGLLEHYTGSIPEANLQDIERVKNLLDRIEHCSDRRYYKTGETNYRRNILTGELEFYEETDFEEIYKYPSLHENIYTLNYITNLYDSFLTDAQKEAIQLFPFTDSKTRKVISLGKEISGSGKGYTKLFIVAPAQEMNNTVEFNKFVQSEDPFVCSYTPFGIMIYTKWGDESEDEILKKYEELIK